MAKLKNVIAKEMGLLRARNLDTASIRTVCLALGPQRNLTTLTGALLFLHPRCQVLNHAGVRVFGDARLDFLAGYSPERFERFLRYGLYVSREPRRSRRGGSITSSHAFVEYAPMREAFERSGLTVARDGVEALFWKESIRSSARLRECGIDVGDLLDREPRLRFLMPVRNPLDCAASNLRRKWGPRVWEEVPENMEQSIALVLDELGWVRARERERPDRFLHFFEYDLDEHTLERFAAFLGIECLPQWREHALSACEVRTHYQHPAELQRFYRSEVERRFADDPEFAQGLLRFADSGYKAPQPALRAVSRAD